MGNFIRYFMLSEWYETRRVCFTFKLQWVSGTPRNLQVIWQWSPTLSTIPSSFSSSKNCKSQSQHFLASLQFFSFSSVMIKSAGFFSIFLKMVCTKPCNYFIFPVNSVTQILLITLREKWITYFNCQIKSNTNRKLMVRVFVSFVIFFIHCIKICNCNKI